MYTIDRYFCIIDYVEEVIYVELSAILSVYSGCRIRHFFNTIQRNQSEGRAIEQNLLINSSYDSYIDGILGKASVMQLFQIFHILFVVNYCIVFVPSLQTFEQ